MNSFKVILLVASAFTAGSATTSAQADCSSDVCPEFQSRSSAQQVIDLMKTGGCTTVACLRAYQGALTALGTSRSGFERNMDATVDGMLERQGIPTQGDMDKAVVDEFIQENTFGGRGPYQPYDAGRVGTIYNGTPDGPVGVDTGAGVIYNSPP
ncbi:MAG: hypothetical protein EOS85_15830 [Mesorhizobium sp.]|nr:MAG: hypothetical protein EOS85_15830 [Mesorhizobium sp.]